MEMIKRRRAELKKNGKKGFTLVELIVVIVILAILAAIAVPALTGWIDKAKQSGDEVIGASVKTSLQGIYTEQRAKGGTVPATVASAAAASTLPDKYASIKTPASATLKAEVEALLGTTLTPDITNISLDTTTGQLLGFKYGTFTYGTPAP
ncbi:MAG: type II secretion system GspH family protein [Coriobacteriales bacterium]|jgi:prepilin-type N-terminal cleavage/methylation domain-containing protein|nr:type II secretion system GspH family protein [Coriobacteriales bacterium]